MPLKSAVPKTWIFLRGLSREKSHWGNFPEAFEKTFGVRVVALDLPGNGEHHSVPTPTSLNGLVDFIREEFRKKNPNAGAPYVLAVSLGAMVTLQWMHRYPDEIGGAVLINTSLRGVSPFYKRMSPGSYTTLLRLFMERDPQAREKRLVELTSQVRDWEDGIFKKRAEIQKARPVTRVNALRQILAAMSSPDSKNKPLQPLLLLNSLGDLLVHPDCSKNLADAWKVPLRRHAWAGHDLVLDDPQWTLRAIAEWIDEQGFSKSVASKTKTKS